MNDPQVFVGALSVALDSANELVRIPVVRDLHISEYGLFNDAGADAGDSDGALELCVIDSANNITVVQTAVGSTAFDRGELLVARCDLSVSKTEDKYTLNGTTTSDAQGTTAVLLRVKSGAVFATSSTGQGYIVARVGGAGAGAATGEVAPTLS